MPSHLKAPILIIFEKDCYLQNSETNHLTLAPYLIKAFDSIKRANYSILIISSNQYKPHSLLKTLANQSLYHQYSTFKEQTLKNDYNLFVKEFLLFCQTHTIKSSELTLLTFEKTTHLLKLQKELDIQFLFDEKIYFNQKKINWEIISNYFLIKNHRIAQIQRKTKETFVRAMINLDGNGQAKIKTQIPFFDHMLEQIARHGKMNLEVECLGDLEIDEHHTVEDVAITLGQTFKKALGDKKGIERYAFVLPMDETLASCSLDLSGRFYLKYDMKLLREKVGDLPTELVEHFYWSFCEHAGVNMHLKVKGKNEHHMIEASFKSFAKCLAQATQITSEVLPSTKERL